MPQAAIPYDIVFLPPISSIEKILEVAGYVSLNRMTMGKFCTGPFDFWVLWKTPLVYPVVSLASLNLLSRHKILLLFL